MSIRPPIVITTLGVSLAALGLAGCYEGVPSSEWGTGIYTAGLGDEGDTMGEDEAGDADGGGSDGDGSGSDGGGSGSDDGGSDDGGGGSDDGGSTSSGDGGSSDDGGETGEVPDTGLVGDMALARVEVTQGVAIQIGNGSSPIPVGQRNARLVAGRDALVRAEWQLLGGFSNRQINGVLVIDSNGSQKVYEHVLSVSGASNINSYNGTFRWEVPGSAIAPGATYSIGLYEVSGNGGGNSGARLPADGMASLGVPSEVHELEIMLVPIRWVYGGQDRTPNLTNAVVQQIQDEIWAKNPVVNVNVSVHDPVVWNQGISLDGILNQISSVRSQDNPPDNVYYEGLADFGCFAVWGNSCSNNGGTTGLGFVAGESAWSANQRASISVFYDIDYTVETLTHELGHNQGREHAPCGGVSSSDPYYPYGGGAIGVQGHRLGTTNFYGANNTYDYMGYCDPGWVSDYTWEATGDRIEYLTNDTWSGDDVGDHWILQGLITEGGEEFWTVVRGRVPAHLADEDTSVLFHAEGVAWEERPAVVDQLEDSGTIVIVTELPQAYDGRSAEAVNADILDSTAIELRQGSDRFPLHVAGNLDDRR